jgi:hypothetical protein
MGSQSLSRDEPALASLSGELLGYALDQVDWFEVADAFLEAEQRPAQTPEMH